MHTKAVIGVLLLCAISGSGLGVATLVSAQTTQTTVARQIGAIKTINGNSITLTPNSGPDVVVNVDPNARLLQLAPGEKDLKNTTPILLQDLHVGDTIRARGYASDDGKSLRALEVILITRTALNAVSDQIRQDWQKRGLGGLVSAVDPAAKTVTISVTSFGGKKNIAVHTTDKTVFRRYAPDSVKFDDAKPSTIQEIKPGDQLRARGDRSSDGSELTADEIVSGRFRNVAGLVNSIDASAGTITVQDLLSKKPVQVKIAADSQLHKLPPEMAQRIAMRLKGAMPPGTPGAAGATNSGPSRAGAGSQAGGPAAGMSGGPMGGGMRQGSAPDFQQMLSRMPAVTLNDLHKGDAVLVVTTEGTGNSGTAITLLGGVEPILQAAPNGSDAMMLAPWSLGGAPGGDASQ